MSVRVGKSQFSFDAVMGERSTQVQVYERVCRPVLLKVIDGFNGTVMAYGQTGSGKTYTMQGSSTRIGVIPRLCEDLFAEMASHPEATFTVQASYVELYLEGGATCMGLGHGAPGPWRYLRVLCGVAVS